MLIDRLVNKAQTEQLSQELESLKGPFVLNNYYRFLYYLVEELRPAIAIEIGVDTGIASAHMVAANQTGLIVGVDIHSKIPEQLKQNDKYLFLKMSSLDMTDTLESLTKIHGPVGLVYQDSSHHYFDSKQEWELISPFCKPGAVWVCDDITPAFYDKEAGKGMIEYFEEIPKPNKRLYQDVLHYGNCQGIVII